jgi:hypothetical protein
MTLEELEKTALNVPGDWTHIEWEPGYPIEHNAGEPEHDPVSHPLHYCRGGIECIAAIEAWGLNYNLGSALAYIMRAGHKEGVDPRQDIAKAQWYIARELKRLEGDSGK